MDNPFISTLAPVILISAIALAVEGIVEYLGARLPSDYKPYFAAALAVIGCVVYNADILAIMGYQASVPYAGAVLTGLIAGRGSNYLHTFWKRLQVIKTPAADVDAIVSNPAPRPSRHATGGSTGATSASGDRGATPPTPDEIKALEADARAAVDRLKAARERWERV